jgi:hypothetical protein
MYILYIQNNRYYNVFVWDTILYVKIKKTIHALTYELSLSRDKMKSI